MDASAPAPRSRESLLVRAILVLVIVLLSQAPQPGYSMPGAAHTAVVSADHSVDDKGHTITFCLTLAAKEWEGRIFDIEFNGSWAPGIDTPVDRFTAPKGWQWEPVPTGGWRAFNPTTALVLGERVCFTLPRGPGPVLAHINLTATDARHHPVLNIVSSVVDPNPTAGSPTATATSTVTPPTGDGTGANQDVGTVRGAGFAFVNGRYLTPPYTIRLVRGDVYLNGAIIAAMPRAGKPERAPSVPRSAYDLVAIGAARMDAMARQAGTLTAIPAAWHAQLAALLRSYAATARVSDVGGALMVTDRQGRHAVLLLDGIEPYVPSRLLAAQRAMAIEWRDTLATGGVLLFGGGSVTVGQPETTAFLHGLLAAFAAPVRLRRAALTTLVGNDALARALLAAGPPPPSVRLRLAGLETVGGASLASAAGHASGAMPGTAPDVGRVAPLGRTGTMAGSPAQGPSRSRRGHHASHTPRTRFAYIFSTLIWKDDAPVIRAASLHGYTVLFHTFAGCGPGDDTLTNLIAASGKAGILYIEAHGSPAGIALESHCSSSEAADAVSAYLKAGTFASGEIGVGKAACFLGCDWFVVITPAGIQHIWRDANTIVHLRSCSTYSFAAAFNAREFIASPDPIDYFDTINNTLWDRIAGIMDGGENRNVGDAFSESELAKRGYLLHSREHGWTVLSPAVASVDPRPGTTVPVGTAVHQLITLDTPIGAANPYVANAFNIRQGLMVDAIAADNTCHAWVDQRASHWVNDRVYEVVWVPFRPGSVRFYLAANLFFSSENDAQLDGNQQPAGTDHVGPNGDPYIYPMRCVEPPGAPIGTTNPPLEGTNAFTFTYFIDPLPTDTATSTATVTPTRTGTPTATNTLPPPPTEEHFTSPYTNTPTATATAIVPGTATSTASATALATATATIPAAGGQPGAAVSPGGVDFGSQPVGTTSQPEQVTITSTGGVPLQITGVSLSGAQASAFRVQNVDCQVSLEPHGQCGLLVFFTPSQPGVSAAVLSVSDTAPDSPQQAVLQGVGGTGGGPPSGGFVLTPNPATVFGSFQRTAGQGGPPSYQDTFRISVNGGAISISQQSTGAIYSGSIDAQGNFSVSNGMEQYRGQLQPNGACAAVTNTANGVTYSGEFVAGG